jgi:hypothetical protein
MNEELTTLINKELSRQRDRKRIIQKVCQQGGLPWKEAERLVILVEAQYKRKTVTRQSPPLLFLSIAILFLGIGLLAFNMPLLFAFFQNHSLRQALNLPSNYFQTVQLLGGLGLTTAGMIGLRKALLYMFPN